jgi:hypothetical protein
VNSRSGNARSFPNPRDQVFGSLGASVGDTVRDERALVPVFDLAQNRLQIVSNRLFTFAGVLDFDGLGG